MSSLQSMKATAESEREVIVSEQQKVSPDEWSQSVYINDHSNAV